MPAYTLEVDMGKNCMYSKVLSLYKTMIFIYMTCYASHIMSYNVIYHIQIICIFLSFAFMFHACIYLRSGYGKELYVPEGTLIVRDSDSYLYDPNWAAIMIQTGSMSSTQTGPRYL